MAEGTYRTQENLNCSLLSLQAYRKPCQMNRHRANVQEIRLTFYYAARVTGNLDKYNGNGSHKDGLCHCITVLRRNGSVLGINISTHFLLGCPGSNGLTILWLLFCAGQERNHIGHTNILNSMADREDKTSLSVSESLKSAIL